MSNRTHNRLSVDVLFLIILLVGTFLINFSKAVGKDRSRYFILLIVVFIFLVLGISTPMINIEAKISRLTFFLLGENIIFENQVLFFQSKSIMDVVWVLISTWKIDMIIVGIMIFTFSVLFPFTKIFCSFLTLQNPTKYRNIKWISFFTFKSGKWSMADVFVIAIFMAFIGFNGIVSNQLKNMSKVYENVEILTTNGTSLQMGFYLFLMFCITGLFLSDSIKKHIP